MKSGSFIDIDAMIKNPLIGPEASNCQTMAEEDGNPPEVAACQHWVGCPPASLVTPKPHHPLTSMMLQGAMSMVWRPFL